MGSSKFIIVTSETVRVCPQRMPFSAPEKISETEFEIALSTLHKALSQLPEQIPFKDAQSTAFKQFFTPFTLESWIRIISTKPKMYGKHTSAHSSELEVMDCPAIMCYNKKCGYSESLG